MPYRILAHSSQTNQTQQEIELDGNQITEYSMAMQRADAFANLLNTQRKLGVVDWQGQVELN
jgi:hypothetical protein